MPIILATILTHRSFNTSPEVPSTPYLPSTIPYFLFKFNSNFISSNKPLLSFSVLSAPSIGPITSQASLDPHTHHPMAYSRLPIPIPISLNPFLAPQSSHLPPQLK
jgi:hypothetical protein